MFWERGKCWRRSYRRLMGFATAESTRAKKQANHVEYDARAFTERICTRLDGFGRVLEGSGEMSWMVEGWWLRI